MKQPTIEYIGQKRAALLGYDETILICAVLNSASGLGPMATPDGLHFFGLEFAVGCIREKLPLLNPKAQGLALEALRKLETPIPA